MSKNIQNQLIFNGKHKMHNFIKKETSDSHKKANIFIIKQTLEEKLKQEIINIMKSICDLQSQLYYSIYVIKDQKFNDQNNNSNSQIQSYAYTSDLYKNTSDLFKDSLINIELSKIIDIDVNFLQKLKQFQAYKRNQLLKFAQEIAKRNWFKWFDQILNPENQELRYQIFSLYQVLKNILNQGYQCVIQIYQNFNPGYNLLMHTSSIIQSIFCQEYEQNKILDFPRFIYINLTGKESKENLQFWREFNYYYQRHCLYFSIYWIQTQQNMDQIKRELNPSVIQTIIPYFSVENVKISKFEMKILFNQFIKNKLIQFRPIVIYVDISNTQYFQIQEKALQILVGKLRKYAKVVIHIKFDKDTQQLEQASLSYLRILNACLFGIQRIKTIAKKDSYKVIDQQQNKNYNNFFEQKLFGIQKSMHLINFFRAQQHLMNKKKNQQGQLFEDLYFVIMQENQQNIIIKPKNHQKNSIHFQQVYISYTYKIIILLDFLNQNFYYYSGQDFSTSDTDYTFNEFEGKIPLRYDGKLRNGQIIIYGKKILFVYPITTQGEKSIQEDVILIYCLQKNRWDRLERNQLEQIQNNDQYFDNNENTERYIQELRQQLIVGQTVCQIQHQQDNFFQVFALFGGEIINSFQPMNLIEYIFVDFENKLQFYSQFIKRHNNPFFGSIKPSPNSLVLPINTNSLLFQNIEAAYLILRPWNQTKTNYYDAMLNPQNINNVQILFQYCYKKKNQQNNRNQQDCKNVFFDIDYQVSQNSKYLLNILEVINSDMNWIQINQNNEKNQDDEIQWEWRVIYTRYCRIKNLQYLLNKKEPNIINSNTVKNYRSQFREAGTKLISFEFIIRLKYSNKQQQPTEEINNSYNQSIHQSEINLNKSQLRQVPFLHFSSKDWTLQTEIVWDYNIN
ncbi:unnamed protein product [Paramecium sonneborni]|uniref:Uncharacterized protein n=1 Tax=Paramecium sonneborni TaxID=65129 RepID=A0A8S1LX59_9CILI|nr:unnamed protein product [Paramecium sonneborni]